MIILIIIILFIFYFYNKEYFNDHGRLIAQANDRFFNDNVACDFHSPNDSEIAYASTTYLEDEIEHCYTFGRYSMTQKS